MKINRNSLLFKFLLFIPFVGILSNNLSTTLSYFVILLFIFALLLFKIKTNQVDKTVSVFFTLMILSMFFSFIYQQIEYSYNNIYFIQFFGSQLFFFFVFTFFANIKNFINTYIESFFKYMIIIIFLSVIIDTILLENGLLTSQLMYKPDHPTYNSKPLGIFGQFSINSAYIVCFYLLYKGYTNHRYINHKNNYILFIMVTITIILQDSGTGYIAYLLLFITLFYKNNIVKYIFFPILFVLVGLIIYNNIVAKISFDYFLYLYQYFENIISVVYIDNIYSLYDVLFGINGNYNFPIDFGPLFLIAKVGLVYFILYSIAIFYLVYKSHNNYIRMAILILILSNIHYPTLFYPVMNVLLPLLLLYLINSKKGK